MSTVSGVGGLSQDLSQLLAQLARQREGQQTGQNANAGQGTSDQSVSGSQHPHHHHGGIFKRIESAVVDALQSSDGSSDPNQIIQDAIAKALQGNTPAGAGTAAQAGSDSDQSVQAAGKVQPSGKADRQAFMQLLEQHGISADQFRQDLLSALQAARGGQMDSATALQTFAPGAAIDASA